MLQPKSYPNLIGQALLLDDRPFHTMVDDDNPWAEGLMLTVSVGVLVSLAQLCGGWLTSLSLPPADAFFHLLVQIARQITGNAGSTAVNVISEEGLSQLWRMLTLLIGYDSGWARLLILVWTPLGLIVQWLGTAFLVHSLARFLQGDQVQASFNQTLGATSLMVAPAALGILSLFPFTSLNPILTVVWSLLIVYRGLQIAHRLPWRIAALLTLAPAAALVLVLIATQSFLIAIFAMGGRI